INLLARRSCNGRKGSAYSLRSTLRLLPRDRDRDCTGRRGIWRAIDQPFAWKKLAVFCRSGGFSSETSATAKRSYPIRPPPPRLCSRAEPEAAGVHGFWRSIGRFIEDRNAWRLHDRLASVRFELARRPL